MLPAFNNITPKQINLQITGLNNNLYKLRINEVLTDIIFDFGYIKLSAHKMIIAASSDYFLKLFMSEEFKDVGNVINVQNTPLNIFEMFLDYVYGNNVVLSDWRIAFELFIFMDRVLTEISNKDKVVVSLDVQTKDYIEYIKKLDILYHGNIPLEVVEESAKYVKEDLDLSEMGEQFVHAIMNSNFIGINSWNRYLIYEDLVIKGYNYANIVNLEDLLTTNIPLFIERKYELVVKILDDNLRRHDGYYVARGRLRRFNTEYDSKYLTDDEQIIYVSFDNLNYKTNDIIKIDKYDVVKQIRRSAENIIPKIVARKHSYKTIEFF